LPIKAGIIGAGFIGPVHLDALRRLVGVEVIALAEIDPASGEEKAAHLGIPLVLTSEELLTHPEIQVVHICTPNHLHYPLACAALAAGKHIMCEKPLALDSGQGREMVERAASSGLCHGIDFNYRGYPLVKEARRRVADGEIGKVRLVHGSYLQDWLLFETDYNWRLEPDQGGSLRAVADIGSHWCDLVEYVTGARIVAANADLATLIPKRKRPAGRGETFQETRPRDGLTEVEITTEDYAAVLFRLDQAAHGTFMVSQVSAGHKNRLSWEIDGEKSALAWNQEEPETLWIGHRDQPNQVLRRSPAATGPGPVSRPGLPGGHPEGYNDAVVNVMAAFYAQVESGSPPDPGKAPYPTFNDGLHALLVCEAIAESARRGTWVEVADG